MRNIQGSEICTEEQYLVSRIQLGDKNAFSYIFRRYYKDLVLFGGTFLPDLELCEDIIQSIFLKLWKDRTNLLIESSLKAYLLKAVRNSCVDEIRHIYVIREHKSYINSLDVLVDVDTENYILYSDLYEKMQQALEELSPEQRQAFEMNRFEGLKYREIAQRLNVSERTVEVRISKAIQLLRVRLKDFLILLIYLGIWK